MKKYLTLLLVATTIIFVASFTSYSYGQSSPLQTDLVSESETFVFVQTFLKNSNGQLITYLTSDKFTDINSNALEQLLDAEVSENDPIVTIAGQDYQLIKRKLSITYDKQNVIASTILATTTDDSLTTVARFAHDGYPIVPNDVVHSIWTFLRPI